MATRSEPLLPAGQHPPAANPPITPPTPESPRRGTDSRKFPLLINDKPLDNYSPLGAPDPQKQWVIVGMLLVLSALQGATWGALRSAERTLGGHCDYNLAKSRLNGSIGASPTLCTTSALFQGISLCLFAPIGGILLDRGRIRNALLQVATLGICVAGAMLVVIGSSSGDGEVHLRRVSPISLEIPFDPAASELDIAVDLGPGNNVVVSYSEQFPYLPVKNNTPDAPPADLPDDPADMDPLGWVGLLAAAAGLAMFRPLPSILVADQTPAPHLKGTFIAWAFVAFQVGELLCMSATDSALHVAGSVLVAAIAASVCIVFLLILNRHLAAAEVDAWPTGDIASPPVSVTSRSDLPEGPSLPFASILSAMASKPALRMFALALLWRTLLQTALAWTKQAHSMDDTLCVGDNYTASISGDHFSADADCIKVGSAAPSVVGAVMGLLVIVSLQSGGFKSVQLASAAHFSSWPLDRFLLGAGALSSALSLSTILQLAVQAHPVHIFWQVPQYMLLSAAEVLLLTAGLEYAYTVSAPAMRARATAIFLSFQGLGMLAGLALEAMTSSWTLLAQLLFFALSSLISVTLHLR